MIKLLIFDLDGTLLDTIRDITGSVNYAVEPSGVGPLAVETIRSMVGSGITKLLEELLCHGAGQGNAEAPAGYRFKEAAERFVEHYSLHLLDNTRPYPGVTETLQRLTGRMKVVVSNKRESFSKRILEGCRLLHYFDAVLGSDSVSERKPSPVPVLEALRRAGVQTHEAVMIGDSNFDIAAGRAAGIRTVAVTYGYRDKEVLEDADYMIDAFGDLLALVPGIEDREPGLRG